MGDSYDCPRCSVSNEIEEGDIGSCWNCGEPYHWEISFYTDECGQYFLYWGEWYEDWI